MYFSVPRLWSTLGVCTRQWLFSAVEHRLPGSRVFPRFERGALWLALNIKAAARMRHSLYWDGIGRHNCLGTTKKIPQSLTYRLQTTWVALGSITAFLPSTWAFASRTAKGQKPSNHIDPSVLAIQCHCFLQERSVPSQQDAMPCRPMYCNYSILSRLPHHVSTRRVTAHLLSSLSFLTLMTVRNPSAHLYLAKPRTHTQGHTNDLIPFLFAVVLCCLHLKSDKPTHPPQST